MRPKQRGLHEWGPLMFMINKPWVSWWAHLGPFTLSFYRAGINCGQRTVKLEWM